MFFLCSSISSFAQEQEESQQPMNLVDRFSELKSNSETYNEYKVIKSSELNSFWEITYDSLTSQRAVLAKTETLLANERVKTKGLEVELGKTKAELETSIYNEDHMSLFGIDMKKGTYAVVLWLIVAALLVVLGLLFTRLKYSISLERRTRKEFEGMREELRTSKGAALDREMKLKRELQTAINTLNDLKSKGGSRR